MEQMEEQSIYPYDGCTISVKGEYFFIENKIFSVIGIGETIEDATNDFDRQIKHFYDYYKKLSWDNVIGEAKRLKHLYESI